MKGPLKLLMKTPLHRPIDPWTNPPGSTCGRSSPQRYPELQRFAGKPGLRSGFCPQVPTRSACLAQWRSPSLLPLTAIVTLNFQVWAVMGKLTNCNLYQQDTSKPLNASCTPSMSSHTSSHRRASNTFSGPGKGAWALQTSSNHVQGRTSAACAASMVHWKIKILGPNALVKAWLWHASWEMHSRTLRVYAVLIWAASCTRSQTTQLRSSGTSKAFPKVLLVFP